MSELYFEDRKVKEVCEAENGQVGVVYEEGEVIPTEVMHKDEWEAGKGEEPLTDRQLVFVKSSENIQKSFLDTLIAHNVRFDEIPRLLDWLSEAMGQSQDKVVNACYGTTDWRNEVSVDMLGEPPELENNETADALAVYLLLKERGVKLTEVPRLMQSAMNMVNRAQIKRLEAEIGRPVAFWRMDDLAQYLELKKSYAEDKQDPQGAESQS